jgi:transposase-like protein
MKAEKFYADKAPWLIKGIISAGKTYIHQTFGKRNYVERVILEIKQFTRKFRRPFQNLKSFYLNLKGFEVFYNFFRFHQSLKNIPASSIKS